VPLVLQAVEVVPVGSISSAGFVVVAVPPVNHVPASVTGGADAAPFRLLMKRVPIVMFPEPSTLLLATPA
jgi:hypothetical protein